MHAVEVARLANAPRRVIVISEIYRSRAEVEGTRQLVQIVMHLAEAHVAGRAQEGGGGPGCGVGPTRKGRGNAPMDEHK